MKEEKLTQLVNPERVRLAIKKLFTGAAAPIVGEILQNAQRAGAKQIQFITSSEESTAEAVHKIRIRDDGSGILNDIEGWHTLLSIADSGYKEESVRMQAPLGVGLQGLFACDRVHRVSIRSRGKMIEIDPSRWWDDKTYYSTWVERLARDRQSEEWQGLELEIECDPKFVDTVIHSLTATEQVHRAAQELPARGYAGVIEITLNGKAVDTSVLSRFVHLDKWLIWEGDYLGNRLKIGYGAHSCVNWFGQAVEEHTLGGGFSYYLEVRSGTPLDMQSPTRQGVISNGKREALRQFITDRIFEVVNSASIEEVKLEWVSGLYHLDGKRADAEAKYYIAGKIGDATENNFSSNEEFESYEEEVKAYDDPAVLLISHGVTVEYEEDGEERKWPEQHGIETFIKDLQRVYGRPYTLVTGDSARLKIRKVVWRPQKAQQGIFVDAGVFTLTQEGATPQERHAVTGEVFIFKTTSGYDISDAQPLVAAKDRYAWLSSHSPWAFFDPDENSFETCRDSFENSITDMIVKEFPHMIAQPFSLSDLSDRLGERVTEIKVVWRDKEQPLLKVSSEGGQEVELTII